MTEPTRLLIHGASGRMGQALLRLAADRDDLRVVAAASRHRLEALSGDAVWIAADSLRDAPQFDVAIDFSLPEAFDAVLALCVDRRASLVSGTTGISAAQRDALERAGTSIPTVWAANFSLGVAVLGDLVARAARARAGGGCALGGCPPGHNKDAPSGTALALGARAEAGGAGPRYASLRAGDIVGEHLVQFATAGERIELVHRATSRDIFASGALHVARRLHGRPAGAYRVADLLD